MRWRLKSPGSRWFAQPYVQAPIKENIKAPRHWPLWGELTLIFALINGWVNNGEAGDLRRHCAHYDVTVMEAIVCNRLPFVVHFVSNLRFCAVLIMTSSWPGNTFRVTSPLIGESTGDFPSQRASNADFEFFLWCKQSSCRWFEGPWRPCDVTVMCHTKITQRTFNPNNEQSTCMCSGILTDTV